MSLFRRHNRCIGIRLWKRGRHQLEVWFCPGGERIEPHRHNLIDSKIFLIAGSMHGFIASEHGHVGWKKLFRFYEVPAGTIHSANITGWFCIFGNCETWRGHITSASEDFEAV